MSSSRHDEGCLGVGEKKPPTSWVAHFVNIVKTVTNCNRIFRPALKPHPDPLLIGLNQNGLPPKGFEAS